MKQNSTNQTEFTKEEIDFLRKKGMFSHIASKIPSTRRQYNRNLSAKYVSYILTGKSKSESETVKTIKQMARDILDDLNND
jgi:hypothetical protein